MSPYMLAPRTADVGSRRNFLKQAGNGFGSLALANLLSQSSASVIAAPGTTANPLGAIPGHFPAKAKSVIWLFMNGGPSHVDTWDYKPELAKRDGQELLGFDQTTGFFEGKGGPLMKSPFHFSQFGESGAWVSSLFPQIAKHVDRIAFIHSCWTDSNNHSPAIFRINSGVTRQGFPCLGSWVTYGLGSENQSLPAFIVMYDTLGRGLPKGQAQNWGAGFLPSVFQGTALKPKGAPIENLRRPAEVSDAQQRSQLVFLAELNRQHQNQHPLEPVLSARIESFELAYRMQMAAPEALDIRQESDSTHHLYGIDNPTCAHFAKQCLTARRLVERGVRFIQIYSGGTENELSWDGHANIASNHSRFAAETDQPIAALLNDLSNRGLLDETMVIWGGEFGRLPLVQKGGTGRDHNPHAFTTWLAGGGIKGGTSFGQTDDFGYKSISDRVSVNDLHATILNQLGLSHELLIYRHNGRDFRLTDTSGRIVTQILENSGV